MTPATAATRVRQLITEAYQTDATYRAVIDAALRDLATMPVPAGAMERTWELIKGKPGEPSNIPGRIFLSSRLPDPVACPLVGGRGEGGVL